MKLLFNRHTLVWIRPECRAQVCAQIADDALFAHAVTWLAADRPLVVARQPGTIAHHTIVTGLALPPAQGKRRLAFNVAENCIDRHAPPLRLSEAIPHAPAGWQAALAELHSEATDIGLELRVFGSLAWQALSGLRYLGPQSDIDLLWHARSPKQLQQGIALLMRWEQSCGMRADGEILFGRGSAVSWREWAALNSGNDHRVLVKRERSAELVDRRELLEILA